jgi:hypothetical protein
MEEYLQFLKQWILSLPPLFAIASFCLVLVCFLIGIFLVDRATNIALKVLQSFSASILVVAFYFALLPTIYFIVPPPYHDHAILSFSALGLLYFGAIVYRGRRRPKSCESTYFSWSIPSWEMNEKGDFKQRPTLIINGEKYVFDTPDGYIYLFQEMLRLGADKVPIDPQLVAFRNNRLYRKTCRATLNLSPDPVFLPSVQLPQDNFPVPDPVTPRPIPFSPPMAHAEDKSPAIGVPSSSSLLQQSNPMTAHEPNEPLAHSDAGRDPTDKKPVIQTLFEFGGSYIVLAFLILFAATGVLAFVLEGFPPALLGVAFFGGGAFVYWKWHQRPRTIVSATAPPIAPVAPPASGNMRVQMQRREVVRRQKTGGLSSVTFNTFELILQVQFSETALKTIHHAGLLSYIIHGGPKNFLDDDDSPVFVSDLIGKPLTLIRESVPEINEIEAQLRASLSTLSDYIKSALQTPTTGAETFEL